MRRTRPIIILATLIAAATVAAASGRAAEEKQNKWIEVLKSNAAKPEKAIACKQLAIYGNQDAVPALAALLPDKELSSWARIALEAIPGPVADDALRAALGKLQGRLLVGVINSTGVRRDAKAADSLVALLANADVEIASAAAVALGHIGGPAAVGALEQSLAKGPAPLRSAAAEGCILCAERILAEGKSADAIKLFDAVRKADVPRPRMLEATRGMMLAQGAAGIPLLVEQLRSTEKSQFALGLRVARELPGREVTECLVSELKRADAARQCLLILALADRRDVAALPAVLEVAKRGPEEAKRVALRALARLGNVSCVPVLLDVAQETNEETAQTALSVLADMPGPGIDDDLVSRLSQAEGKSREILIGLAGQRPLVKAVPVLLKAAGDADGRIRAAALAALGATIEPKDLPLLMERVVNPRNPDEMAAAEKALAAAIQRMPDREATTQQLVATMSGATAPVKCRILEILGTIGGAGALRAVGAAAQGTDPQLQDTASRLLGDWMDLEAAPVLLDLAKKAADEKYRIRAMRGYIRLLRQFDMSDAERAEMCRTALATARRNAEKKLVLEVMGRHPGAEMLSLALETSKIPELKSEAIAVAMLIAEKSGGQSAELKKMLADMGHSTVKIEIVKAEYGAGSKVKDVTTILRKHVHDFPVIVLPSPSYNATFGGDPAPGVPKQLKIQYRMADKPGEVTFTENASIQLPKPK